MTATQVGTPTGAALTTAATSIDVPTPAGTDAGDVMFLSLSVLTNTTLATPSGWTLISTGAGTGLSWGLFWKVATASEPANQSFTGLPSFRYAGMIATWRGVDSANPIETAPVATTGTTSMVAFSSITPTTAGAVILARRFAVHTSGTFPTSYTSSNMTVGGFVTTSSGSAVNIAQAVASQPWTSGAFTPNLTTTTGTTQNRAVVFAIRPRATITAARSTTWNVLQRVARNRSTTWNVAERVTAARAATWNVLTRVTRARSTTWNVLDRVARNRSTTWNVLQRVARSRSTTWNVAGGSLLTTVTVTIGEWTQTWELDRNVSPEDEAMVSASGAILDGLTASWSADGGMMSQPGPVVTSFRVYVPAGAAGPVLDEGTSAHVLIEAPGGSSADYLPLLDTHGRVSDGGATPTRDGLTYDVVVTDSLASLGESMVGGLAWPQQWAYERVARLKQGMHAEGQTLDWSPIPVLDPEYDILAGFETDDPWQLFMGQGPQGPIFAPREPSATPTNEVVEQVLREHTRWGPFGWEEDGIERDYLYRTTGDLNLRVRSDQPQLRKWMHTYGRLVAHATADPGVFGLGIVSPRVPGNGGLPLELTVDGDGLLTVHAKGLDGVTPNSSKFAAWVPGCAVPKDGVKWSVNRDAHPQTARGTGWFVFWTNMAELYTADYSVGYGTYEIDQSRAEAQIDLPEISQPTDVIPTGIPAPLLYGLVGWDYDKLPLYELTELPIRYDAIDDSQAWPRLFQQPEQDIGDPADYFAGAQGRFVFLYDVADRWHPYGMDHWWGFLTGATLTVTSGRLEAVAQLAHRLPGPNGSNGTPTDPDGHDRWKLFLPGSPRTVTWDDLNADPDTAALTWDDVDPTLRWSSLYLTTMA